jgi:hypothetical protein
MQVYLARNSGGSLMKSKKELLPNLTAAVVAGLLFASISVSCGSMGNFMPLASGEKVIGTVQASFTTSNSLNVNRDVINTNAYIKLLEAAQEKYGGDTLIDIRDIVWAGVKDAVTLVGTAYSATGKVIQVQ